MKSTTLVIALFFLIVSCSKNNNKQITDPKDYSKYLKVSQNKTLKNALEELNFWSTKFIASPTQFPYLQQMAAANSQLFSITGNIQYLKDAEKNLVEINEKSNFNNASYLRSLARNYVSQHRFKEALAILLKAEENGENIQLTEFQLIDVYLELGNTKKVSEYLSNIKDFNSFDYLIRVSKYNDFIGNLDSAIGYLEKALHKIEKSNKPALIEWAHANLGDYYGHAGRLHESYQSYLKALAINPSNSYAKKGIAWIVFSHEKNSATSLAILAAIEKENMAPDLHLLKAEIAEFMGNFAEKEKQTKQFFAKVSNENYGVMYSKNMVLLLSENAKTIQKAIAIAEKEVAERPTPQSHALLAWSYYKNGNVKKALTIAEKNVLYHTFEPELLLQVAQILRANNHTKKVKKLLTSLEESSFELGPNASILVTKLSS